MKQTIVEMHESFKQILLTLTQTLKCNTYTHILFMHI